jgi:AsmA family protein
MAICAVAHHCEGLEGCLAVRRVAIVASGLLSGLVLCAVAAVVALPRADLRPYVARWASETLGRTVSMRGLRVGIGDPLVVDIEDATLANIPAAADPDMVQIGHLSAELDLWPLLRGALVARRVAIDGLTVALERDSAGEANWRFRHDGKAGIPARARAAVPTILDLTLTNAKLTMRTSGGSLLRMEAKTAILHTTGDDAPISLIADGAYGDTPVRLDATLQSFAKLRDLATPFGVTMTATAAAATLAFKGTATDPLNADGVVGDVRGDLERLDTLLAIAGMALQVNIPLRLTGPFTRQGDAWGWPALTGDFAGAAFGGHAELAEGGRAQPDRVRLAVDLARLDANALLKATASAGGTAWDAGGMPLLVMTNPGLLVEARLGVKQLALRDLQLADVGTQLSILPGKLGMSGTSPAFAGGRINGAADVAPAGAGAAIASRVTVAGLDVGTVLRLFHNDGGLAQGRLDGGGTFAMSGRTLSDALGTERGQVAITIARGQVRRQMIQMASTDVGALFNRKDGMTPILCFLAVADTNGDMAALSPVRLRTNDGTMIGGGRVNLRQGTADLDFATIPGTTGFLSLDIPLHVSGSLADLRVALGARGVAAAIASRGAATVRRLPADLAPMATANGCEHTP